MNRVLPAILSLCGLSAFLFADIIVLYDAGEPGASEQTAVATTVIAQVEASLFDTSPAQQPLQIEGGTVQGSPPSPGNLFNNDLWNVSDDSRFYEFTVTVSNGFGLDVQSLEFWERSGVNRATNIFVRYSVDNFENDLLRIEPPDGFAWENVNVDLASSGVNSGLTGSVTFRIHAQGTPEAETRFQVDHVQLNGQVIPEPASVALLLLSFGALALLRHRFRRG